MAKIIINHDTCNSCQLCIQDCPGSCLENNENNQPVMPRRKQFFCIRCGHCASICPEEAIQLDWSADLNPVNKIQIDATELSSYFRQRRTIRQFQPDPVPQETLEKILATVRYAPSSSNTQPVQWLVISGKDKLHELAKLVIAWAHEPSEDDIDNLGKSYFEFLKQANPTSNDLIFRQAPTLVIAMAEDKYRNALIDSTIALTHFELLAPAHGLGCCWTGFFMRAAKSYLPIEAHLNLKPGQHVQVALCCGFPDVTYGKSPPRNKINISWR